MAYLLAAPIVLDTYNFKDELKDKKWSQEDSDAHKFLSQYGDYGTAYWKNLNDAKFSIEGELALGLRGIFIRDYKNYDLKIGTMGAAVSTVLNTLLFDKFGEASLA